MRIRITSLPLLYFALFVSLSYGAVQADELPLTVLSVNDPDADYSHDQPAVVLFQNFTMGDNSPSALDEWVTNNFGAEFTYVRDAKSAVPSAVISRFSIAEHGVWSDLEGKQGDGRCLYARIDLPGETDLWVINAWLSSDSALRLQQTQALVDNLTTRIPVADYVVVGGQLNITDNGDPAFKLLQETLGVEGPLVIQQDDGKTYDWLLADANLMKYQLAQAKQSGPSLHFATLDIDKIRTEIYRLLKTFQLSSTVYFDPPPPVNLENGVTVEDAVSGLLLQNRDEYRFTPAFPGMRAIRVEMESTGPGDADLQLAYWDYGANRWIFYANQATPGTSDESITITQLNLLNHEWRIIVEH
ncbi:MAG: hypothetical protein H6969_03605, partial [Gammaproteobacteria bacterium]|nr:hypothetical protein [Gammaproteobacteria bacterium]